MDKCGWQEAAYRLALDSQVDCMEIDVSRTLDGVLVTLHDRYGGHFVCLQWDNYSFNYIKQCLNGKRCKQKLTHAQNSIMSSTKILFCAFSLLKIERFKDRRRGFRAISDIFKGRDLQAMHGNPAVQVGHFTFSQVRSLLSYMLNK